jgi:hypothetical protein
MSPAVVVVNSAPAKVKGGGSGAVVVLGGRSEMTRRRWRSAEEEMGVGTPAMARMAVEMVK